MSWSGEALEKPPVLRQACADWRRIWAALLQRALVLVWLVVESACARPGMPLPTFLASALLCFAVFAVTREPADGSALEIVSAYLGDTSY